jgi:hypothetical protein
MSGLFISCLFVGLDSLFNRLHKVNKPLGDFVCNQTHGNLGSAIYPYKILIKRDHYSDLLWTFQLTWEANRCDSQR